MNHYTKFLMLIAGFALASSCKTSDKNLMGIDRLKGEVNLYSSSDDRSALVNPGTLGSVKESQSNLNQHLKKNPKDVPSLVSLAQIHVAAGRLVEAEKAAKNALRYDLNNKDARIVLAQVAMKRNQFELAEIFLTSVGGEDSKDSHVLNMLAMIQLKNDRPSLAMTYFKKSLVLNPNDVAARMNLGVLYVKYKQLPSASIQFERVIKIVPEHADAMLHLAVIKSINGEKKVAREMYKSILKNDRGNPLALYNLAVLERKDENYSEALALLNEYIKSARGHPSDNETVFALIDDIQRQQAAQGGGPSDSEIQAMAAKMITYQEKAQQEKANEERSRLENAANNSPNADRQQVSKTAQPRAKQKPAEGDFAFPEESLNVDPVLDEVSEMEDFLQN